MRRVRFLAPRASRTVACALAALLGLRGGAAIAQTVETTIVRGRVVDSAGSPIANFPLVVSDSEGRALMLRTESHGQFSALGLAHGSVTVRLDGEGYAPWGVSCHIPAGETASVQLIAMRTPAGTPPAVRCRIEPPTTDLFVIE